MKPEEGSVPIIPVLMVPIMVMLIYAATFLVSYDTLNNTPILFPIVDFTSVVSCVFIAQMLIRKSFLQIPYRKLWLSGWMSALILGLLVIQFQKLYFNKLSDGAEPLVQTYSQLLIVFNIFGLLLSAFFAFILKKM